MATHCSILPGESHGKRSLVGYSLWGHKESDMTEYARTHTHTPRHWVCPAHLTPTRAGWKHLGGVSPGSIDVAVLVRRGKHGES